MDFHNLPSVNRFGDLERYGLVALLGGLLLALGFLYEGLIRGKVPDRVSSALLVASEHETPAVAKARPGKTSLLIGAGRELVQVPSRPPRPAHFDFFEDPVALPGRSAVTVPVASDEVVVKSGDTLQKIAARVFGAGSKWKRLLDANPGINPRRLMPGTRLVVPGRASTSPAASKTMPAAANAAATYVVRANDTLQHISRRFYGTPHRWMEIYEANQGVIKNPESLQIGSRLTIP